MRTVALRFAENFAPECGTIAAHQAVIERCGHVWYGKLGSAVSAGVAQAILADDDPRILLIHSGGADRWWAHIDAITRDEDEAAEHPDYYHDLSRKMGCWFRVTRFERADAKVMSRCVVSSSGKPLSTASRHSMSPYFIIDYEESAV